jgi:hypothetical protein
MGTPTLSLPRAFRRSLIAYERGKLAKAEELCRSAYAGRFVVLPVLNITNVFYGRDVGYTIERIVLDEATEAISATHVRRLSASP